MDNKKTPIPFKLIHIEEKQFSVFEDGLNKEDINQKIGIGFHVDVEKNVVAAGIHYLLETEEKPFINIELICYFEIDKEAFQSLQQDKSIELPKGFARHLAVITSGTVRGVLFANTKGTPFNSYFMGLIDITGLIEDNIVIEF